jgi:beta-phosphoglucomutase-like phosphatase (HAD superfamily)
MIQTVIFDMDGVIVDTEPVHRIAYFQHFEELNIKVTEEMFTSFTGIRPEMFSKFENHFQSRSRSGRPDSEKEDHIQQCFDTKADLVLEGKFNRRFS